MTVSSTIVHTPRISELVAEGRRLLGMVVVSEKAAQVKRMEMGRFLLKVRETFPRRGTSEQGWGAFLQAIELDETTAYRYMKLAEATLDFSEKDRDRIPTYADLGLDKREGAQPDPDAPPPTDDDAPFGAAEGARAVEIVEPAPAPAVEPDRNAWCTPSWLTALLPEVDLDPCSNPYSTVRASKAYMLEAGQDGLALPWKGLVFVNPPYSRPLPWAQKLEADRKQVKACGFLMNTAGDTEWWQLLAKHLPLRLDFNKRIQFQPPPGLVGESNDRPQTLLMDSAFWRKCNRKELLKVGTLWERV